MSLPLEQLEDLLKSPEHEQFECKEAKTQYKFERLVQYCVALANEGGGRLILGVTDKTPHEIVGSNAFKNIQNLKQDLTELLDSELALMRSFIHREEL